MDGMTTDTDNNNAGNDILQAVRESAMLADVTISVWNAEKSDKTLLDQLKSQHGTVGNVGRVVKNTLAGADGKLKDVRGAYTAVRSVHYALTLPWVSDPHAERQRGARLLPHLLFDRYMTRVFKQRKAAEALLAEFLVEYPALVAQAKANLAGMADASYPTEAEVRASFRVHLDFEPIPAGASFKGLPEQTVERLANALQQKQERMVAAASTAMWDEAKTRVGHIVERLADPETTFKASTIENVRELLTLLPGWDLTGDPRAAEIIGDIRGMLDGVAAEQLRKDVTLRADTTDRARAIADKLTQWGV